MTRSLPPWDLLMILAVMVVVVPWRGKVRVRELLARPLVAPAERIAMYASTIAFQWVFATVTAWRCYARGWNAGRLGLLLDRPLLTVLVGGALALVLALLQLLSLRRLSETPEEQSGFVYQMARKMMPQSFAEGLPFVALVCTVSLCEEFLYRGFAFAMLETLGRGSLAVGVFGSAALFGIGHLYQGWRGVVTTSVLGVLLAGVRVSIRVIWCLRSLLIWWWI